MPTMRSNIFFFTHISFLFPHTKTTVSYLRNTVVNFPGQKRIVVHALSECPYRHSATWMEAQI